MTTQTVIDLARGSFAHALEAAEPGRLVAAHLPEQPPDLILAVGKGALGMLAVARERAPTAAWLATPPAGVASGPHLVADAGDSPLPGVSGVMHGTHPLPGPESEAAAAAALAAVPGAAAAFDALSYTLRKEHVRGVEEAKSLATRERRIARIVAGLGPA